MNGCNVDICWEYVKDNLSQVQQEIEDCKGMDGWDQQCQVREAAVHSIYRVFWGIQLF